MNSRLLSSLCLLMALLSVLCLMTPSGSSGLSDIEHFAYIPLVKAEEKLEKGESGKALDLMKIALTRSSRCGKKGISMRILTRIANTGAELFKNDPAGAWMFLSFYALASDDFGGSSTLVENWCYAHGYDAQTFHYEIKRKGDPYTVWGSRFSREPLLEEAAMAMLFSRDRTEENDNQGSLIKGFRKTWAAPIRIISAQGMISTEIHLAGLKPEQRACIRTSKELIDTGFISGDGKEPFVIAFPDKRRYVSFYELLVQSPYGHGADIGMEIIKKYEHF